MKLITLCIIVAIIYIAMVACCGCVSTRECQRREKIARQSTIRECGHWQRNLFDYVNRYYKRLTTEEIQARNGGKK